MLDEFWKFDRKMIHEKMQYGCGCFEGGRMKKRKTANGQISELQPG